MLADSEQLALRVQSDIHWMLCVVEQGGNVGAIQASTLDPALQRKACVKDIRAGLQAMLLRVNARRCKKHHRHTTIHNNAAHKVWLCLGLKRPAGVLIAALIDPIHSTRLVQRFHHSCKKAQN